MKKSIYIIITLLTLLNFSACSSSGDNNSTADSIIQITTYCVDDSLSGTIQTYHALESGDTIVKDEIDTVIEIYHQDDNNKYVCLVNGTAHILR